jgi:hypothetical protein
MEIQGRTINYWTRVYLCAGYDGKKFYKLIFTTYRAGEKERLTQIQEHNTKRNRDSNNAHGRPPFDV